MTSLGRFRILGELGRGGMGVVLRAYDPDMAREVAIKVLRTDAGLGAAELDDALARFDREAKAAGALNHPGIVTHYERGESEGRRYIVMEYVEGRPLHLLMTEGPRPTPEGSLSILRQMAAALDYAHSRGVIHRDIKPANVLVEAGGTAKIADFGIAKYSLLGGATASSVVIGSPHYMAPEQIEARPVDARTDQWALAVTGYELLTGAKPFQSESVGALFQQILVGAPPDPRERDPDLPAGVAPVFERALSKAPEARFESCTAFVEALSEALAGAAEPAEAGPPVSVNARRVVVRVKPVWMVAAAAFVVLFGAALWWGASRLGRAPTVARAAGGVSAEAHRTGEVRGNARDRLNYVWIGPGRFRMGCSPGDRDCRADEAPAHDVTISRGYWLGQTEVTVEAFQRFCRVAGGRLPPAPSFNPGWSNGKLPVTSVGWEEAARYCGWTQGRLPAEAEWEYAARGGAAAARYGPVDQVAWTRRNSGLRAQEVGRQQANAYGLFDMLGNVWEWTADFYDAQYYDRGPVADPHGPEAGRFRVLRGGSWLRDPAEVRVSLRYAVLAGDPDHGVGFRCAIDEMP